MGIKEFPGFSPLTPLRGRETSIFSRSTAGTAGVGLNTDMTVIPFIQVPRAFARGWFNELRVNIISRPPN
jgi:hypothetical protein